MPSTGSPFFDETFWASVEDTYSPATTAREVDFLLNVAAPGRPGRVLDLGCGEGRHAVLLGRRGWNVIGVDSYLPALQRARANASGLDVHVIAADMRALPLANNELFDGVIFMQNTFGYLTDTENFALLRDAADRLVAGGWIYLDCANVDAMRPRHNRMQTYEIYGGDRHAQVTTFDYPTSRLRIDVTVQPLSGLGQVIRRHGDFRMFRPAEVATLLHLAGFAQIRLYGDFRLTGPVTQQDRYFQAIARLPATAVESLAQQ